MTLAAFLRLVEALAAVGLLLVLPPALVLLVLTRLDRWAVLLEHREARR